jgi:4-hydroxybenzoate polyprenyltransferase
VLMRSAGCAINDFADRGFDPYVARTAQRPLATGHVCPAEAVVVFLTLSTVSFGLVLLMNRLTVLLSLVAILLAASYPFMKRYTDLPQVYLGAAFGWAVPMAYAAQTGELPPDAWLLFAATVSWAVAYDTLYAMMDREDDVRIGMRSTAILFGRADRFVVAAAHALALALVAIVGLRQGLGPWFLAGITLAAGLALYQQYLVRDRSPSACFAAFLNNHWLGAAIFAGIVLDCWLAGWTL